VTNDGPLPALAEQPPSSPAHWTARDAALRTQVQLPALPGTSEQGAPACACGGTWRYVLLAHPEHPIWRCLHDGQLHRGTIPIVEVEPSPAAGLPESQRT
jgi:hypothetical protein